MRDTYFNKYLDGREPNVKKVETLSREIDNSGIEHVKRYAILENLAPSIAQPFLNSSSFRMDETVSIDRVNRTFRTHSYNFTWAEFAVLQEKSIYTVHTENSDWTYMDQRGTIECVKCPPIIGPLLEKFTQHMLYIGAKHGLTIMDNMLAEKWEQASKQQQGGS